MENVRQRSAQLLFFISELVTGRTGCPCRILHPKMITRFTARGFKTLMDVEIELGQVNVFIGANGSGKSNVLEALGVLAAAAYGRVDEESLVRRGVRPGGYILPLFKDAIQTEHSTFRVEGKGASYEVTLNSPKNGRHSGWEFRTEGWTEGKRSLLNRVTNKGDEKGDPTVGIAALRLAETATNRPAAKFLKRVSTYSIYTPDTPVLRGWVPDTQIREPVGLSGGRLAQAINEIVEGSDIGAPIPELLAAVEWFSGFGAVKLTGDASIEHNLVFIDRYFRTENVDAKKHHYFLSPNDVNEGMLYLLMVAVLCLHPASPSLLAIDNADHSLNPLLARRLMGTLSEWLLRSSDKRQILLTTHNPLALDGLPLQDDRVRLFTVDRDNLGHTQVRRLEITDKLRDMAAKGWTLSRMWVNKQLGGVPDV